MQTRSVNASRSRYVVTYCQGKHRTNKRTHARTRINDQYEARFNEGNW